MYSATPLMQPSDIAPKKDGSPQITSRRIQIMRVLALALSISISVGVLLLTTHFRSELRQLQGAGLLGLFVVSIIGNATVVIPTSVMIFACAGATVYGPVLAGIASGAGSAIGEMTGYLAGYAGNAVIPQNNAVQKVTGFVNRHGFLAVLVLAIIPNPLFDVAGIASGMIGMKWYVFLGAAILGKTLRLILWGWACHSGIPALQELLRHR